ncbi:unnamed protein product, partial [Rotaria sp. Silwood1]
MSQDNNNQLLPNELADQLVIYEMIYDFQKKVLTELVMDGYAVQYDPMMTKQGNVMTTNDEFKL